MRLRLLVVIASTFVVAMTLSAHRTDTEAGIDFHSGTWEEAMTLANQENKLIFLDISASWCGPCKLLKKKTFPDKEVGIFYNTHFINVALDGETGEGAALAKKYGVRGYPTLLFIDGDGNLVAMTSGYRNAANFLKIGQTVVENHKSGQKSG
jgi:thioredoxin-related protein